VKKKIHVFGASGSGTTTIAKNVCAKINYSHFDSDNYFWLPTSDPFTLQRPQEERIPLLESDLSSHDKLILSGSLSGWGEMLIPLFDLVVFVYVPQGVRMKRLEKREYERYGNEILPGGSRHKSTNEFFEWAASYDIGTFYGRNLQKHEKLLESIECRVIKVENDSLDDSIQTVIEAIFE